MIEEVKWTLISGYRRTTFDLPNNLLDELQEISKEKDLSMSEYVEEALREKIAKRRDNGIMNACKNPKPSCMSARFWVVFDYTEPHNCKFAI